MTTHTGKLSLAVWYKSWAPSLGKPGSRGFCNRLLGKLADEKAVLEQNHFVVSTALQWQSKKHSCSHFFPFLIPGSDKSRPPLPVSKLKRDETTAYQGEQLQREQQTLAADSAGEDRKGKALWNLSTCYFHPFHILQQKNKLLWFKKSIWLDIL